eukprot:SAG11_NODE_920_length_6544_cov_10.456323_1_plen_48_part_00
MFEKALMFENVVNVGVLCRKIRRQRFVCMYGVPRKRSIQYGTVYTVQ